MVPIHCVYNVVFAVIGALTWPGGGTRSRQHAVISAILMISAVENKQII